MGDSYPACKRGGERLGPAREERQHAGYVLCDPKMPGFDSGFPKGTRDILQAGYIAN